MGRLSPGANVRPSPFDYPHFRAAVFAAFVTQDWDAVGNALALIQAATGHTVIGGTPTAEQVHAWASGICAMAARDAKHVDEHGDLPPQLQCNNPKCGSHGAAARARLARAYAAALAAEPEAPARGTVERILWGPPVPGIH